MKKFIISIICALLLLVISYKSNYISDFIAKKITGNQEVIIKGKNEYAKNDNFIFIQNTDSFVPYSYNDLLKIIYTTINYGWDFFTFYCPSEYEKCINDVENISKDDITLTHINNYVHPYNSFTNIKTSIMESGEITIEINYLYNKEQIAKIEDKTNSLLKQLVNDSMTNYEKIKVLHDYIINNTKYDVERNKNGDSKYLSYLAYGPLFEGYATCNGYTDLMAIYLTKLGIPNYKIATTKGSGSSSNGHIWNAVNLDGNFLHLDLTWDDPVSDDGKDYLYHKYFLIDTKALMEVDSGKVEIEEHNFDKNYYLEFNDKIIELKK